MRHPHVSAEIGMLPISDGGREIFDGYRGQFHLHGGEEIADVSWRLPTELVHAGESTACEIWFGRPEYHLPRIKVGDSFEIREGARVVGRGKIVSFLEADAC